MDVTYETPPTMPLVAFTQSIIPRSVKSLLDKTGTLIGVGQGRRLVAHLLRHLKLPEHSSPERERRRRPG